MDLFEFSTNMMYLSLYYCLRSPDFGMPNCSRYLATVRREMGTDIQAACGQLRSRLMEAGL